MIPVRIAVIPDSVSCTSAADPASLILRRPDLRPLTVLLSEDRPISVVTWAELESLAEHPGSLADQAGRLPHLLTVEPDGELMEESMLLDLAELLSLLPGVPGALVERDGRPYGVLTRREAAAALPLELLGETSERLGAAPSLPSRRYVCRKCEPPSYRLPRSTGDQPPDCRRVWFHGAMELDGG